MYLIPLWFIDAVDGKLARGIFCKIWGAKTFNSLRVIAIQTIDIFIRICDLEYPKFLLQDICFSLGLKFSISSQTWASTGSRCLD